MDKKRLVINMTAQLTAFIVNLGISFVLTPIVDKMIPNSYGFVNIANQFVQWAQVVVSALNTLASRYITIHLHKGEEQEASEYFSSVFFANMFMAAVFLVPAVFVIVFIDRMFQVPAGVLGDVQILWAFVFLNFFISIITSVFSTSTYSMNRLELSSVATIVTELARLGVLYIAYRFFSPYLFYIGVASVVSTSLMAFANAGFTKKLLPGIKITVKNFRLDKVKELVSLGAWNSVTRLGQMHGKGCYSIPICHSSYWLIFPPHPKPSSYKDSLSIYLVPCASHWGADAAWSMTSPHLQEALVSVVTVAVELKDACSWEEKL